MLAQVRCRMMIVIGGDVVARIVDEMLLMLMQRSSIVGERQVVCREASTMMSATSCLSEDWIYLCVSLSRCFIAAIDSSVDM